MKALLVTLIALIFLISISQGVIASYEVATASPGPSTASFSWPCWNGSIIEWLIDLVENRISLIAIGCEG